MATPNVLILRAPGTNCDDEAAVRLREAGGRGRAAPHQPPPRQPRRCSATTRSSSCPAASPTATTWRPARSWPTSSQHFLADALREFRDDEKLILGICNGFQVLLKAGLLVPPDEDGPLATLAHNDSGQFEDRWVHLQATPGKCPFLKGIDRMHVPIAHGEGNFVCRKEWIARRAGPGRTGRAAIRRRERAAAAAIPLNPNGSQDDIAGICDATGRVLGLMPHPERHVLPTQHPQWTRQGLKAEGDGLQLFRNAVEFFAKD